MPKEQTNSWEEEFDNEVKIDKEFQGTLYKHGWIKNFISKTISQEREKLIGEIKKLKTYHKIETNPEMTAKGIKHGRAIMTVDRQEVINLLQNK